MSFDFRFYMNLVLRRLPAMLLLILASTAVGLLLATGLPTVYVSQARLLVQGQEISETLAESTVQIAALEEIEILREQVMTRDNLIDIAHRFEVFEDIDQILPDEVAQDMRNAVSIVASGGGNRRNGPSPALMTISVRARSGQIAADVANDIVTRITDANVRIRVNQADQTLDFFEQQVERLSSELATRSARISAFQSENSNALPADQEFRLQRQSLLQERIAAAERERRALEETRERTIQVFATGTTPQTSLPPDQQLLQELEAELANLLLTFSENANQVQTLQRRIEQLEARIALQLQGSETTDAGISEDSEPGNPLLALQLAEIDARIENIDVLIAETQDDLRRLSEAIAQSPRNAIELDRLQREYDEIQIQYDNASRSLAQAAIGEQLERGGRGQRIMLLDPPVVPNSPTSPNRRLIAVAAIVIGFALAGGLFFLLEFLNRSIRRPTELVKALGVTPFAVLPYIETTRDRLLRRTLQITTIVVLAAGVPAGLWAVHEYYMPLDQLSVQLLNILGLT